MLPVVPKKIKNGSKKELKLGHVVQLRNGDVCKLSTNEINGTSDIYFDTSTHQGVIWLHNYTDKLECIVFDERKPEWDIVKIYEEKSLGSFIDYMIDDNDGEKEVDINKYFNLVWEKEDELNILDDKLRMLFFMKLIHLKIEES